MIAIRRVLLTLAVTLIAACGGGEPAGSSAGASDATATSSPDSVAASEQRYPDIVEVMLTPTGEDRYNVTVTVSSPYDTPQRYADGWRVLTPDGTEIAAHTLAHDHAGEQPFTRTQTGVEIPASVTEITVEGRDQQFGYGGTTVTVTVPR